MLPAGGHGMLWQLSGGAQIQTSQNNILSGQAGVGALEDRHTV